MKKLLLIVVAVLGAILFSCQKEDIPAIQDQESDLVTYTTRVIPGKYIVRFNETAVLKSASKDGVVSPDAVMKMAVALFNDLDMPARTPDFVYSHTIQGIAVSLSESEAAQMANALGVKSVEPDMEITLNLPHANAKPAPPTPVQPGEIVPPGITRVGGGTTYTGTKKAWVIDTGIDLTHPDLNVDVASGRSFVPRVNSPNDDNGHGSHCAGIIGAIDNSIGVVGVAPGVKLVPVKVLDKRGSGAYSVIIAGVDYVAGAAISGDVANLSLGGPAYQALDDAILRLAAKGVNVSLAAGNSADDATKYSPARVNGPNIYTVSAMDANDVWAYFSNYGNPPIDYCAPGVKIYSTYKGGGYATLSGTSMAAPHVCGLLLLGPVKTDSYVIGDPDEDPDPIAHK
ncbi:subtilase family [Bacteroidales bacterium 6E]|nr:subtilase family [Bacteroidales bacterium 6E]